MEHRRLLGLAIFGSFLAAFSGVQASTRDDLFAGNFSIRKELSGVHPRLFCGPSDLSVLRARYAEEPKSFVGLLPSVSKGIRAPARLQEKENGWRAQELALLGLSYRISGLAGYLEALRAWESPLREFEPIAIDRRSPSSGNKDLSAGGLMMGLALLYDMTAGSLPAGTEQLLRAALVGQARRTYEDLRGLEYYHYEQNHLIIPVCGLGLAAMALADELPEAAAWGSFARNLLGRTFDALAPDGWFFEGVSYWNFTMQLPVCYAVALRRTVGEDLLGKGLFAHLGEYLEHQLLPDPEFAFDFADWGPRVNEDGSSQQGYDQAWHTLPTRVSASLLFLLNREHPARTLEELMDLVLGSGRSLSTMDRFFLALGNLKTSVPPSRMSERPDNPPFKYFADADVLYWRSNWSDPGAAALAFRSGPPAGHGIAALYPRFPEWRPGLGHAHPDAGSFLLFARGRFLANDTGYATKETRWHNAVTVDGQGQGRPGTAWNTFAGIPYERLNRIREENVWLSSSVAAATAVYEDAYAPELRMKSAKRHLIFVGGTFLVVLDQLVSDIPHRYQWFLHTDWESAAEGADGWRMDNGEARLVVRSLLPFESSRIGPTIVETQIGKGPPRPQQRGFHLELESSAGTEARFLNAMAIQHSEARSSAFQARCAAPGRIELIDGDLSCTVWIGAQAELDGSFGFVLRRAGKVVALGAEGIRLDCGVGRLTMKRPGAVVLRSDQSRPGFWIPESPDCPDWVFE